MKKESEELMIKLKKMRRWLLSKRRIKSRVKQTSEDESATVKQCDESAAFRVLEKRHGV